MRSANFEVIRELIRTISEPFRGRQAAGRFRQGFAALRTARPDRAARTAAGWRAYGPDEMARVAEIAALRELGLSLSQVARVLEGYSESLEPALAAHQAALEVASINSSMRLKKSAACAPTSQTDGCRLPANSRACLNRPPASASCSTFRGPGRRTI